MCVYRVHTLSGATVALARSAPASLVSAVPWYLRVLLFIPSINASSLAASSLAFASPLAASSSTSSSLAPSSLAASPK